MKIQTYETNTANKELLSRNLWGVNQKKTIEPIFSDKSFQKLQKRMTGT